MRVRMLTSVSGSFWVDGEPHEWPAVGEEGDLPDDEGARLCAHGMAEPVIKDRSETRPAPTAGVEKRQPAKRAAAKKTPAKPKA